MSDDGLSRTESYLDNSPQPLSKPLLRRGTGFKDEKVKAYADQACTSGEWIEKGGVMAPGSRLHWNDGVNFVQHNIGRMDWDRFQLVLQEYEKEVKEKGGLLPKKKRKGGQERKRKIEEVKDDTKIDFNGLLGAFVNVEDESLVTKDQLREMLVDNGMDGDMADEHIDAFFTYMKIGGDKVKFQHFSDELFRMCMFRAIKHIRDNIHEFDDDGDKRLDWDEFTEALRSYLGDVADDVVEEVMEYVDKNDDGEVTLRELGQYYKRLAKKTKSNRFDGTALQQFKRRTKKIFEEYNDQIPGMVVTLVQGGETRLVQGYGTKTLGTDDPVTGNTLFHIGSCMKAFSSLLAGIGIDKREVPNWNVKIKDLIDGFEMKSRRATNKMTLRSTLNMTSGIGSEIEERLDLWEDNAETLIDMIQTLDDDDLLGPVGEQYDYSNVSISLGLYGVCLAAGVAHGELNEGFKTLMRERVLEPLGMENTFVDACPDHKEMSSSHEHNDDDELVVRTESDDLNADPTAPSGCMKSCGNDMAKYLLMELNEGVAADGKTRIISRKRLRARYRPNLQHYGMGWEEEADELTGCTILGHEGSWDNFNSNICLAPEANCGYFVSINTEFPENFIDDMNEIFVTFARQHIGEPVEKENVRVPNPRRKKRQQQRKIKMQARRQARRKKSP